MKSLIHSYAGENGEDSNKKTHGLCYITTIDSDIADLLQLFL